MGRVLLCLLLSCGAANATDVLPAHLVGTWGTGASLHDGTDKQTEIYLLADGFGMAAGSTEPAPAADGHGPRAIIGGPVQATLDGDTLSVRPLVPKEQRGMKSVDVVISCRYKQEGQKLACTGPDGVPMTLARRSVAVDEEIARTIDQIRTTVQSQN